MPTSTAPVEEAEVSAYIIPTSQPESDGTLEWTKTTLVVVELLAVGERGLGYTYADVATARLISDTLLPCIKGKDAFAIGGLFVEMRRAVRNLGRPGVASMAISAVDTALWDLKARLLGLPLATLLGTVRQEVPIYGSGGFTSYTIKELIDQLTGWEARGFLRVKMKIGREPARDIERVRAVREVLGSQTELYVDANGALRRKQALSLAPKLSDLGVSWFEEPVSSDDLSGLRLLRDRGPAGMDIAAGEYGYDEFIFRRMLEAEAVDVLQADVTRCGGVTGFMRVAALSQAFSVPLSGHTAPALHAHPGCAVSHLLHLEYFYDHARIEDMLFEGAPSPTGGVLSPDLSRPGLGLTLRRQDAARYAV